METNYKMYVLFIFTYSTVYTMYCTVYVQIVMKYIWLYNLACVCIDDYVRNACMYLGLSSKTLFKFCKKTWTKTKHFANIHKVHKKSCTWKSKQKKIVKKNLVFLAISWLFYLYLNPIERVLVWPGIQYCACQRPDCCGYRIVVTECCPPYTHIPYRHLLSQNSHKK